jgi:hypothetical protein
VWLLLFLWFDTSASEMPNSEFIDGMAYELDGRATMHAITANMAERYADGPMHTYWSSYHRLEAFSKPKYENIARVFGVALPGKTWISVKSKVISCLPGFMIPGALADLRKRTIAYVDKLRWLSEIGPAEERDFYAYMVRQELMQVQLMELALREEYVAAESLVAEFISRESAAGGNSF